jgi:hypothetical protein
VDSWTKKLARGDEHFSSLKRLFETTLDGRRMRLHHRTNEDATEHLFAISFLRPVASSRWGLLLGDAVHSYRAALDHVVYGLAIHQSGQDPPPEETRLMFPIATDPAQFKEMSKRRLGKLDAKARLIIEDFQPYHPHRSQGGLDQSPLWRLDRLDARDKHRLLVVTATIAPTLETLLQGFPPNKQATLTPLLGSIEDGAPFLHVRTQVPAPDLTLRELGEVNPVPCIQELQPNGSPAFSMVVPLMEEIGQAAREAVDALEHLIQY